jgi:hypothetical protein
MAGVFIISAAIQGIIGNRADEMLTSNWSLVVQWTVEPVTIRLWTLFLLFVVLTIGQYGVFYWLKRKQLEALQDRMATVNNAEAELAALKHAVSLVKLDDTLLRLLPRLTSAEDLDQGMRRLVTEFFRDATEVFGGDVSRGMVLRPEGDELVAWIGYQMPDETIERTRFRLDDQSKSGAGVALMTFKDGKPRVITFKKQTKGPKHTWNPSSRAYKVFNGARPHPPYRSFVTVAIGSGGTDNDNLGVVCFDSMNPSAFDPPEIQRFLQSLARRLSTAIQIYQQNLALEANQHDNARD